MDSFCRRLLTVLRRILSTTHTFARHSFGILHSLWALLGRIGKRNLPSESISNSTISKDNGTRIESLEDLCHREDSLAICASSEPQSFQLNPVSSTNPNLMVPARNSSTISLNTASRPFNNISESLTRQTSRISASSFASTSSLHSTRSFHGNTPLSAQENVPIPPHRKQPGQSQTTIPNHLYTQALPYSSSESGFVRVSQATSTQQSRATSVNESDSAEVAAPIGVTAPPDIEAEKTESRVLYPGSASWSERYTQKGEMETVDASYMVEPLKTKFNSDHVPPGWTIHIHPEGCPFFFHEQKRVATVSYICDEEVLGDINIFIGLVEEKACNKIIPEQAILVLELVPAQACDDILCFYYYVDLSTRSLFWLEPFNAAFLVREVQGIITDSHFRYKMEEEYWCFRDYFSGLCGITKEEIVELKSNMLFRISDQTLSRLTLTHFRMDQLDTYMKILDRITLDGSLQGSMCELVVAKMLCLFNEHKFLHFHGHRYARLAINKTIYPDREKGPSWFFTLLSPLLFSAPEVHMQKLKELYVDHIISQSFWLSFVTKLDKEWQDFLLLGEVLLTVNVSFLAIPSVDTMNPGESVNPERSLAQIASYVSIVFLFGSIVLGFLLVRQNHTKTRDEPEGATTFLLQVSRERVLGLESIALVWSLPYALLMWGMIAFIVSFCAMCFEGTNIVSRLVVGLLGLVMVGLILWCNYISWETHRGSWTARWISLFEATATAVRTSKEMLKNIRLSSIMAKKTEMMDIFRSKSYKERFWFSKPVTSSESSV